MCSLSVFVRRSTKDEGSCWSDRRVSVGRDESVDGLDTNISLSPVGTGPTRTTDPRLTSSRTVGPNDLFRWNPIISVVCLRERTEYVPRVRISARLITIFLH